MFAHFGSFFKGGKSWTVSGDFSFAVLWLSSYNGHERGPEGSDSCEGIRNSLVSAVLALM